MPKKVRSKSKTTAASKLSRNRPNKAQTPKDPDIPDTDYDKDSSIISGERGTASTNTTESGDVSGSSSGTSGASAFIRSNPKKIAGAQARDLTSAISEEDIIYSDDEEDSTAVPVKRGKAKIKGSVAEGKHENESISSKESEISYASGSGHPATKSVHGTGDRVITEGSVNKFERILKEITGCPDLTEELERTGTITNYITKSPGLQQYERECRLQLLKFKQDSSLSLKQFDSYSYLTLKMANPNIELMNMSVEDLIKFVEIARNIKIETFEEMLGSMKNIQGFELADLRTRASVSNNREYSEYVPDNEDEDMFDSESESASTPPNSFMPHPNIKKVGSSKVDSSKLPNFVFPSSKDMITKSKFASPLFRFGAGNVPPSTSKAPRLAKPGERMLYSESGSPVMLPRIPKIPAGVPERIPFTDMFDGKKIVEVVLYRGAADKGKEYKDFVTDVRGLVATKSSRVNRVLPPRIPTRGGWSAAAKKPTPWHP